MRVKHDPEKESIRARPEGVPVCLSNTGHVPAGLPRADEIHLDPGKPPLEPCQGHGEALDRLETSPG